jgi:hypothetical protein
VLQPRGECAGNHNYVFCFFLLGEVNETNDAVQKGLQLQTQNLSVCELPREHTCLIRLRLMRSPASTNPSMALRATHRSLLVPVLLFVGSIRLVEAGARGTCFDWYGVAPETCAEVSNLCSSSTCSSRNREMSYSCDGTYSVPAAATATPTASGSSASSSSSTSDEGVCSEITLSSCNEAERKFQSIGCSCFTCVESNGDITASCTSPFSCWPQTSQATGDTIDAPELDNTEYGIVAVVYLAAAAVLVGTAKVIASLLSRGEGGVDQGPR